MIICIDGPSASGKGTIAFKLAEALKFDCMHTGLIYRAVACECLKQNVPLNNDLIISDIANHIEYNNIIANHDEDFFRKNRQDIDNATSIIASIPKIRIALLDTQRDFAAKSKGVVAEGRDMGSVVFPNAEYKFFLDADINVRALRRLKQFHNNSYKYAYEEVKQSLQKRDFRDSTREVAPLVVSKDAVYIDSTFMTVSEVVHFMLKIVVR